MAIVLDGNVAICYNILLVYQTKRPPKSARILGRRGRCMSRFPTLFVSATSIIISILCTLALPASAQEFIEPDWFVEGNQDHGSFASNLDGAGDVNGDGYADIIIGWWLYSGERWDQGTALVYYGGPSGPDLTPDWRFDDSDLYSLVGWSVAGAGDVNGDGYDDVLVGVSSLEPDDHAEVLLFLGGPNGLSQTPDWIGRGIGKSDHYRYGQSMAGAGDVNDDGYDDIIIGDPGYDDSSLLGTEGRAYVYYGGKRGISHRRPLIINGAGSFALSVASAGDVNSDGFDDVIIGEPGYWGGVRPTGRALVFFGFPGGLRRTAAWTAELEDAELSSLGYTVAGAGDVNHDGYDDILVGQPYYSGGGILCLNPHAGRWYVFHGGPDGPDLVPALFVEEPYWGCNIGFGGWLAGVGDVNGDGTSDVAAGFWTDNHDGFDRGTGFIHFGGPGGLVMTPDRLFDGAKYGGGAVAGAGDVNGDGLDDILVGNAEHHNEHGQSVGSASLFFGKNTAAKEARDVPSSSTVVLHPNHPNPFNPVTTIRFELQKRMLVRIDVFDVKGKRVTTVGDGVYPEGVHDLSWAASNVASGVYFVRLVAGDRVVTRRMLLLK